MSNRPYFKFTGDQIRQVFDENQNDLEVLKRVLAELQRRSTPKMKTLRSKVEGRIEVFASSSGSPKTESPLKNNSPKHEFRQSQTSKPEQKSLFGDDNKPHGEAKKTTGSTAAKAEAADSSSNKETKGRASTRTSHGKNAEAW